MKSLNIPPTVFSLSCAILLLAPPAQAQETGQKVNGEVLIRTLGWGVSQSDLYYLTGDDYLPLSLSEGGLSGYHPYSGSRSFEVFRKVTDEATGAERYDPFVESALVAGADQQILVFFQSPTDREVVRVFAYDDSIERMGEQAVFIGNFSPLDLAFQINGEDRFGLKPGESRIIEHNGDPHAVVQIAAYREDQWQVEYRASPRLRRGYRSYFFFRDMKGRSDVLNGIDPIVYKENVARVRKALESPDGDSETGRIEGSTVPFDPEAGL